MKKAIIMLLITAFLLSACSPQNASSGISGEVLQESGSVLSNDALSSEPPRDNTILENEQLLSDAQVYETFQNLYEKAMPALFWYMGDITSSVESLEVKEGDPDAIENPYWKVGRFSSIAEMKAATEDVFTTDFCNAYFYDHAFVDPSENDRPMYKEIDGALFRDAFNGGIGWPYQPTDEYTVVYQSEDLLVLFVKINVFDREDWHTFIMKNDDGKWKFEKLYDFTPYWEYEKEIAPAVSAWLCARDWNDVNELDANSLLVFYADQFLADIKEYNVENGYAVPTKEVLENLSKCFVDLRIEMLTKINDEQYTSASYDNSSDSFIFVLTRDPAAFVICSEEASQEGIGLTVLVIAKSDKASYWGSLIVEQTQEGLRYLSNQFTHILEE